MKDTILNVVYDTQTARSFGVREDTGDRSGQAWYREILYRTNSGKWFLAGAGGNASRYAVEMAQRGRTGSAGIIPLGRRQAMQWLAETGRVEALREFFMDEKEYLAAEYQIEL